MSSTAVNPRVVPPRFDKDPEEKLSYGFDWSQWLDSGDTIASSLWTIPSGITQSGSANTTTSTSVLLAGGTLGSNYTCTNQITTANGLIAERSIVLNIVSK